MIQKRFILEYITSVTGEALDSLWAVTSGLCAHSEDVRWMGRTIEAIGQTEQAQTAGWISGELTARLEALALNNAGLNDPAVESINAYCNLLETESKQFMRELRYALLAGIQVFEELERDTISLGGNRLLDAVRSIPGVLEAYYTRLASGVQALENRGH